jgi:hypothetical protein
VRSSLGSCIHCLLGGSVSCNAFGDNKFEPFVHYFCFGEAAEVTFIIRLYSIFILLFLATTASIGGIGGNLEVVIYFWHVFRFFLVYLHSSPLVFLVDFVGDQGRVLLLVGSSGLGEWPRLLGLVGEFTQVAGFRLQKKVAT